jgi:hypothetical protein
MSHLYVRLPVQISGAHACPILRWRPISPNRYRISAGVSDCCTSKFVYNSRLNPPTKTALRLRDQRQERHGGLGWEREEKDVQLLRNSFSVDLCTGGNCAPCQADQAMDGTDWAGLGAHVCIVGWPDSCGSARDLGFLSISSNEAIFRNVISARARSSLFYCVGSMRNVNASGSGGNDGKCAI